MVHVKLFDLGQMMRCGVGWAVSWPGMQYPFVVLHYLTLLVNVVTALNAMKSGMLLGLGVLEWNGKAENYETESIFPAFSLLAVPYFTFGALEAGMILDNPLCSA